MKLENRIVNENQSEIVKISSESSSSSTYFPIIYTYLHNI